MVIHIQFVGRHARLYHIDDTSYGPFQQYLLCRPVPSQWVLVIPIFFILFPHTPRNEAVWKVDEKGLELAKQSQGVVSSEPNPVSCIYLCQQRTRSNLWQTFCTTLAPGLRTPFRFFCVDRTLQVLAARPD